MLGKHSEKKKKKKSPQLFGGGDVPKLPNYPHSFLKAIIQPASVTTLGGGVWGAYFQGGVNCGVRFGEGRDFLRKLTLSLWMKSEYYTPEV